MSEPPCFNSQFANNISSTSDSVNVYGQRQCYSDVYTVLLTRPLLRDVLCRFVRFASLKEAQRAIELCSNTSVGNTRIIVCPAKESQELFASRPVSDAASLEAGRSEGPVCLQSQRGSEEVGRRGGGGKGGGGRGGGAVGISATPSMQRYGADCTSTSRDGACPLLTHSASTLGDVTSKSRDASPRSDDQSDLDSDFWDEDLLTSIRDLIPIPCRAVPVPVLQPNQRYAGLSPRNTPNEQGLTLVHVSLVRNISRTEYLHDL